MFLMSQKKVNMKQKKIHLLQEINITGYCAYVTLFRPILVINSYMKKTRHAAGLKFQHFQGKTILPWMIKNLKGHQGQGQLEEMGTKASH